MTLNTSIVWEIRYDGSDTTNGGGFDTGSGITRATDLTAINATTSSPTVSSASYNFVAGDVGAWLFIRSGTNWLPGWYQISSVAANSAILNASIGSHTVFSSNTQIVAAVMNTIQGCATTSSPTTGTWSVDYTQQSTSTSISISTASSTATTTILGSFTKSMIGNLLVIPTGITNATSGYYAISAVTAGTSATLDRTWNTNTVSSSTCYFGGALASIGQQGLIATNANYVFQKYNASAYQITSASTNVSGGVWAPVTKTFWIGYNTNRCFSNTDTSIPYIQASGVSSITMVANTGTLTVRNIGFDGQNLTAIRAIGNVLCTDSVFINLTNSVGTLGSFYNCIATNCSTASVFFGMTCFNCAVINCSGVTAFTGICNECVALGCNIGFIANCSNCTAYNCTSDGFQAGNTDHTQYYNCISYGNGGKGFNNNSKNWTQLYNCAAGGNTGVNIDTAIGSQCNTIILGSNPFINSGATINSLIDVWTAFALNNTVGGGASCAGQGAMPYTDLGAVQHKGNIIQVKSTGGFN